MVTTDPEYYIGDFPLIIRRHPRAKHLKLRFEVTSGTARLTLPPGITDRKALQFAQKHHDWIKDQYEAAPEAIPLMAGRKIPFQGRPSLIIHDPDREAGVEWANGRLIVGGGLPGFETRLQNWLKKQARQAFGETAEKFGLKLNCRPNKIMVRDNKSRWGSCSTRKTLSFSWRLIMADPNILRYVVAHEMAHLVEMNHGPAFWQLVEKLYPDWRQARHWLKTKGNILMLIG